MNAKHGSAWRRLAMVAAMVLGVIAGAVGWTGREARAQVGVGPAGAGSAGTGAAGGAATKSTGGATGGAATQGEKSAEQEKVYVGVYINQIEAMDLKNNNFILDFWVWFRWKGEAKPMETFEVIGGHITSKENEIKDEIKGFHYASCRVTATVTKFFDISRFPLDAHKLTLAIEDGEMEEGRLIYLADKENSGVSEELHLPGWKIEKTKTGVGTHEYATNYGNISLETGNKSAYSRFGFEIDLVRPGTGYFFKLFWSLFLATVIALMAMLIDPIDLDPRFGLGVGAIFAAIASAYVISSALPETNQYTLADKLNMLAVGVIFVSILQSVFSLKLWKGGNEAASKLLDRVCFWSMLSVYFVATLVMVAW